MRYCSFYLVPLIEFICNISRGSKHEHVSRLYSHVMYHRFRLLTKDKMHAMFQRSFEGSNIYPDLRAVLSLRRTRRNFAAWNAVEFIQ